MDESAFNAICRRFVDIWRRFKRSARIGTSAMPARALPLPAMHPRGLREGVRIAQYLPLSHPHPLPLLQRRQCRCRTWRWIARFSPSRTSARRAATSPLSRFSFRATSKHSLGYRKKHSIAFTFAWTMWSMSVSSGSMSCLEMRSETPHSETSASISRW